MKGQANPTGSTGMPQKGGMTGQPMPQPMPPQTAGVPQTPGTAQRRHGMSLLDTLGRNRGELVPQVQPQVQGGQLAHGIAALMNRRGMR